jgi:AcrR family transcriptional regulator
MDRRARKKARTRDLIRTVAHAMFAEQGFDSVTIADIAQAADVAVQTVFNHFATKEQLFFDGRTPWVDGAAEAVRNRPLSISALDALCSYLAGVADSMVSDLGSTERGSYIATLEASDALCAYERELIIECERRLTAALLEAWTCRLHRDPTAPADPETVAPLTAATWLAAVRVLVLEKRSHVAAGGNPAETAGLVDQLLTQMQPALATVSGTKDARPPRTGWPQQARQAG